MEQPDFSHDLEWEVDGHMITPDNCRVYTYDNDWYDHLQIEIADDMEHVYAYILEREILDMLIESGFHHEQHVDPNEHVKEWAIKIHLAKLTMDIAEFESWYRP